MTDKVILPPPEHRMEPKMEQVVVELRAVLSHLWVVVRGEGGKARDAA